MAIYNRLNACGLPRRTIKRIERCFIATAAFLPVAFAVLLPALALREPARDLPVRVQEASHRRLQASGAVTVHDSHLVVPGDERPVEEPVQLLERLVDPLADQLQLALDRRPRLGARSGSARSRT